MPFLPIAAFLVGSLLSLLLPVGLLIALSVWYWWFSVRVPETGEAGGTDAGADPAASNPGPKVTQALPHDPGA